MDGKAKKKPSFLARVSRVLQSNYFRTRLFIESGLKIFRLFIRVNRLREIMAALGSGNRFVNVRKAPYFEIHSCLYEIDGIFRLK